MITFPLYITLCKRDINIARHKANCRCLMAREMYCKNKHGLKQANDYEIHREGSLAEMALARALGMDDWVPSIGVFKSEPDVGPFEVRSGLRGRMLIVRPEDSHTRPFVLVIGSQPSYTIHGWIWGYEARRDEWWSAPGGRPGAWFVPTEALHKELDLETISEETIWTGSR